MAIRKYAVAAYDDEEVLFPAVKAVRNSGYKLHDVYTPFPVHGLDNALGLKETDLHVAGFIYGITGTATALGFISWILASAVGRIPWTPFSSWKYIVSAYEQ